MTSGERGDERMDLANLDLNLLVVLDALLRENSVTRAAHRLHISQPAASRALGRLRDLFDDQLLIRSGAVLVPTPLAVSLKRPLERLLSETRGLLRGHAEFDPATAQHTFVIATVDYAELIAIPHARRLLAEKAPRVDMVVVPPMQSPLEALQDGTVDVQIGVFERDIAGLVREMLYEEDAVLIAARDNDAVPDKLSMETYLKLPHLAISSSSKADEMVDEQLASRGLHRRVAMRVPNFIGAPLVVGQTDLVALAPRSVAETVRTFLPIKCIETPFETTKVAVTMLWHERNRADPAHRWLRTHVAESVVPHQHLSAEHEKAERGGPPH